MMGIPVAKEMLWPSSPESQLQVAFLDTAQSFTLSLWASIPSPAK